MGVFDRFFTGDKIKGHHLLALDIGTEVVKALIFKVDKDEKKVIILGVGRQLQDQQNMMAGAVADIGGVIETCQAAVLEAQKERKIRPKQAMVGIAGEFVRGKTSVLTHDRENPKRKIDLPELKNIIQKLQWKAFDKIRQEVSQETGISEIEVNLINAAITNIRIDGYLVNNPLGFQGHQISFSIFNVYAPLIHLGALQSITSGLGMEIFSIAAEPYAIARAVGPTKNEAIFIDVGGGTTDIAVVRQGGVLGTKSLALGGRAFTRRLATLLDLGMSEAEEIKLKYTQGEVSTPIKRKITEIFKQDIGVWRSGVELALSELTAGGLLPSIILLCGGGSVLPGVRKALEDTSWQENLPFPQLPSIDFIQPEQISCVIDQTGQLIGPEDITPMALAGLSLDLIEEENMLVSILRRTVRMMQR